MGKLRDLWPQAWLATVLAVLLLVGSPVSAAPAVSESALKAALLLKLGRYTYFPGDEQPQQQRICVLGQSRVKADLEKRLGLKIVRVEVGAVDFLTDMTMLRVYYDDPKKSIKSVDRIFKIPADNY